MDSAFRDRLEQIDKLPTLPVVINKLDQAVQDPDADIRQVTGIIQDDPSIMARILRVANTVFYTTERRISDLRTAVVVMGLRSVHNIALSTAVFSTFPPTEGAQMDRAAFWKHSIYTATATESVASFAAFEGQSSYRRDELHLAGLMHDIGKIVLEQFFHRDFTRALELSRSEGIPLCFAENRIFGSDHTQVGVWLGDKWNLSREILETVRWHHHPEGADPNFHDLVRLCHLANHLTNSEALGDGGDHASYMHETAFSDLGISPEDWEDIAEKTRLESRNSQILLEMVADEGNQGKTSAHAVHK